MNPLLHTPDGVRDVYNNQCEAKTSMEEKIMSTIAAYGYERIETPSFEYFDIFGKEIGTTPSKDLYKFFDREGNTLVLRPDVTPSIARVCATYFKDYDQPVRLCYDENVFINYSDLRGRLKEHTQIGAELIGDASVDADAEIIAMAVESLRKTGLNDFTISIGHGDFFNGLVLACGFTTEEIDSLRELIINKNIFGLEEKLRSHGVGEDILELYSAIGKLFNSPEEWAYMYDLARPYDRIYHALSYCENLFHILELYGVTDHLSFELGLISQYNYYTGIIFSGYTYGSGEPILSGGRYDRLLSYFGKEAPAIGFAIICDQLLFALERHGLTANNKDTRSFVVYDKTRRNEAIAYAKSARESGQNVWLSVLPENEEARKGMLDAYDSKMLKIFE